MRRCFFYYSKAAIQGEPLALYQIGLCYKCGKGVKQDSHSAIQCFRKSTEAGHRPSMYQLGLCYELGFGVEKDFKKAVEYYALGASGDQRARAKFKLQEYIYNVLL